MTHTTTINNNTQQYSTIKEQLTRAEQYSQQELTRYREQQDIKHNN